MNVSGVHHVNITAPPELLPKLRDFYSDVLGLVDGDRPKGVTPGYWMYAGDNPIVHITACRDGDPRLDGVVETNYLDHVSFRCQDLMKTFEHLAGTNLKFEYIIVPNWSPLTQIYLRDPAGTYLELTFIGELPSSDAYKAHLKTADKARVGLR